MSACYFWKDGEVITVNSIVGMSSAKSRGLLDLYCVDNFEDTNQGKFGMFTSRSAWRYHPLDTFPKEFRAWLLINL